MKSKDPQFHETNWFEIFEPGDYAEKGNYSPGDVNDMADAINNKDHIVPIVIGHATDPQNEWDKPLPAELADGALNAARVQDNRLQVKARVSDRVKNFFDDNRLHTWSAGIYKNFKGTGKKAVRHLAALGKTPPHLKGLNYTPQFTFSEDEQNGEYITINFNEPTDENSKTSKGERNMDREAQLEKENADLRAQLENKNSAAFDEMEKDRDNKVVDLEAVRKERDELKKRAEKAEADAAETKENAAFAEIETKLEKKIEAGLPKDLHDDFRALCAHEMGLVKDGVATFAENKTSDAKITDLIDKITNAKMVPLKEEGSQAIKNIDMPTFSEDDIEGMQKKRMEIADARLEEMKKTNEAATFSEAAQETQNKHPELYPDIIG